MTVPFVGREKELSALREALAHPGHVVAIAGEAGVGKTRLAGELAAEAAWGTCADDEWTTPYAPWAEALLSLHLPLPAELNAAAPVLSPDESTLRLHDAFAAAFRGIPGALVVLDDMQWADRASAALLRVLPRLSGATVVVLYRSEELEREHPLHAALSSLARQDRLTRIGLGPLPGDDAETIAHAVAGDALPQRTIEAAVALSGGNAFFLTEIVRHVIEEGGDPAEASENIRVTVGRRASRLSPETQSVLSLASAFTRPFTMPVLQALTELSDDALDTAIDETVERGLLREVRPGTLDFAHALVRAALYEQLGAGRRARVHRRIALAIEHVHAGSRMEHAEELASQYARSASLPGAERGVEYAIAAAEHASAASAPAHAADLLERALGLAGDDTRTRGELMRRRALALAEATDVEAAVETAMQALGGIQDRDDAGTFAAEVVSTLVDGGVGPNRMAPLITRGLGLASEGSTAWALLRIAEPAVQRAGSGTIGIVDRLPLDPDAVRILRAPGNERNYARTIVAFQPATRAEIDELLGVARRWSDARAKIRSLSALAGSLIVWCGAIREAGDVARELVALAEREHSVVGTASGLATLAETQCALGELDAARETRERLVAISALAPDNPRLQANFRNVTEIMDGYVGCDWAAFALACRARIEEDRRALGHTFGDVVLLIRACGETGDRDEAERLIEMITPLLEERGPRALHQGPHVSYVCEAIWSLRLDAWAPRFRTITEELVEAGVAECSGHSHELAAGRMAALAGKPSSAREWFSRARERLDRTGQRPLRAIVEFDDASVADDAAEALRLLEDAHARFKEIGMTVWIERASRAIAQRRGRRDEHGLSRRERDVIRRIAQGRTNKEIAEELSLSIRTVERHVLNLYTKIGVRRRADAAAYAVRQGL